MSTFYIRQFINKIQYFFTKKKHSTRIDWITPFCILALSIISVFFVYSAQGYGTAQQWKSQIFWFGAGFLVYLFISFSNYKLFMGFAHIIYGLCLIALLALWTPLGQKHFGCLRWINLKFFSFQPSESAKIGTLILVASLLARSKIGSISQSLATLVKVGIASGLPIVLIFLQPDLGSALVLPPMVFSLLYVSKIPNHFFMVAFALFIVLLSIVSWDIYRYNAFLKENNLSPIKDLGAYQAHSWLPLKDYQRNRILSFAAPEVIDPKGIGVSWNLRQSLISVGSGGLWGKGHNKGTQAKLGYLPQSVATNDFIFSVLSEEAGFLGSLSVLVLYATMVANGLRIASLARDRFGCYLAVGVSIILMTHVFINVGMTIGIMPITGVPLPFLSYGGSFVLSCCILQGLVQSVYRFRKDFS